MVYRAICFAELSKILRHLANADSNIKIRMLHKLLDVDYDAYYVEKLSKKFYRFIIRDSTLNHCTDINKNKISFFKTHQMSNI